MEYYKLIVIIIGGVIMNILLLKNYYLNFINLKFWIIKLLSSNGLTIIKKNYRK